MIGMVAAGLAGLMLLVPMAGMGGMGGSTMLGAASQWESEQKTAASSTPDCGSGSGTVEASLTTGSTSLPGGNVAAMVATEFAKAGYSKAATAGVLGNMQQESSFQPAVVNSLGYAGLVQTQISRYEAWFQANNMAGADWRKPEHQVKYLLGAVASKPDMWNNVFLAQAQAAGVPVQGSGMDALYQAWLHADTPEHAAAAWEWGYERAGDTSGGNRARYARAWYESDTLRDLPFKTVSTPTAGANTDMAAISDTACRTNGGAGGNAEYGSIGGAPVNMHDYSWMCNTEVHVCKAGDPGALGYSPSLGYQCWWYALNRLWMIHRHDISNDDFQQAAPNGYAGWISQGMAHMAGWETSASPHPGDGVSQLGGALGGSMSVGHIGVVEEVKNEGGRWRIRISEGNYGTDGSGPFTGYNSRWLSQDQFAGAGSVFFRKQSWNH